MPNRTWIPDGLCPAGKKAASAILELLRKKRATSTGGGDMFRTPADHAARGEKYGAKSVLVVCYDGGAHRKS